MVILENRPGFLPSALDMVTILFPHCFKAESVKKRVAIIIQSTVKLVFL